MRVYKLEETACDVCLDIFAKWRVKPNDVALSIPAWLLCYMWHVFQLVAEVAMSWCVLICLYCIVEYLFVRSQR